MTIQECISKFNYLKPHGYDDETLCRWLKDLEERLHKDIYSRYEEEEDTSKELSVPEAYSDLYIYYLQARVDYFNGETARYNNSMNMYNTTLGCFADAYNRTHTPLQREVTL
ncbi:MAG: hypothetical protein IJD14_00650 [Christensenellaceae bacterium]|nr:hypothetical protein [Christensenellaceae bacterium]